MTIAERTEIAALAATLAAFLDRYDRDQEEAKEYRITMLETTQKLDGRISHFEHLQSKAGGVVLAAGFVITALAGVLALGWKWVLQHLLGVSV